MKLLMKLLKFCLQQIYWFIARGLNDWGKKAMYENLARPFTGYATGIAPMVLAAIISAAASVAGSAMSDPGKQTVSQESALSPEQKAAMQTLLQYAKTGELDGVNTKGMYSITPAEAAGQDTLVNLLADDPKYFNQAGKEYSKTLDDGYNPYTSQYFQAYKNNTMKELASAADALNASLGASGKFFSTSRDRALADLYSNAQRNLDSTLAGLYEKNIGRKYNASGALTNLQNAIQQYDINKINAANTYGGVNRNLQKQQLADRMGAYSAILNKNVDYYTPKVSSGDDNSTWNSIITGGLSMLKK